MLPEMSADTTSGETYPVCLLILHIREDWYCRFENAARELLLCFVEIGNLDLA